MLRAPPCSHARMTAKVRAASTSHNRPRVCLRRSISFAPGIVESLIYGFVIEEADAQVQVRPVKCFGQRRQLA